MLRALAWVGLVVGLSGCGGKSDLEGPDNPSLSDAELSAAIEEELESLNSCSSVDGCMGVSYPACSTSFTGRGGNHSELDALLEEYGRRRGPVGCDASCACGALRCEAGRCVARPSDCMGVRPGEQQICL